MLAALDLAERADAAQQMLIDRIVMIHVELHHRHDAAEGAHELAEHAGLVHPPQHGFRLVLRGQNLQEQPVRFLVLAQSWIDQVERARRRAHGFGMDREIVLLRQMEQPDQVDRIALEDIGPGDVDAVVVDDEIVGLGQLLLAARRAQPGDDAAQHRRRFRLTFLEAGAENGGEIADVLGDEEVVLHEALDVAQTRMLGVAEPHRDLALDVERQALLGAAGEEMHVAADRPEEILAAAEQPVFVAVEHAALDQFLRLAHAVDVFGDPEQRVQVAQSALAVLDVGLDEIARLAGAAVTLLALGELGGDEFRRRSLHHLLVEARRQLAVERGVAEEVARFQKRGADGHIGFGLADAFVDRTRRVTDLEAHVPQAIEQSLGHRLAPGGLLVGQHEQEIDVGARRQQPAAIAAGCDHRHAFGLRTDLRRIKHASGELEEDADDLVLGLAQPLGAAAAVTVLEQQLIGACARLRQRRFEARHDRGAQFPLAPGVDRGERFEIGDDRGAVDEFGGARLALGIQQHLV